MLIFEQDFFAYVSIGVVSLNFFPALHRFLAFFSLPSRV
jgi:hypothetical protein